MHLLNSEITSLPLFPTSTEPFVRPGDARQISTKESVVCFARSIQQRHPGLRIETKNYHNIRNIFCEIDDYIANAQANRLSVQELSSLAIENFSLTAKDAPSEGRSTQHRNTFGHSYSLSDASSITFTNERLDAPSLQIQGADPMRKLRILSGDGPSVTLLFGEILPNGKRFTESKGEGYLHFLANDSKRPLEFLKALDDALAWRSPHIKNTSLANNNSRKEEQSITLDPWNNPKHAYLFHELSRKQTDKIMEITLIAGGSFGNLPRGENIFIVMDHYIDENSSRRSTRKTGFHKFGEESQEVLQSLFPDYFVERSQPHRGARNAQTLGR